MFPTHVVTTAATTAFFLNKWGTSNKWLFALGFLAGALPDLDLLYYIFYRKKKPFGKDAVTHRQTFLHAPLFYIALFTPLFILAALFQITLLYQILVLLSVGVFSHILMDMVLVGGVPLLWPLDKRLIGFFISSSSRKLQRYVEGGGDWFSFYMHHPLFYFESIFLSTMIITQWVKPSLVIGSILFFAIPTLGMRYKQKKQLKNADMERGYCEIAHN